MSTPASQVSQRAIRLSSVNRRIFISAQIESGCVPGTYELKIGVRYEQRDVRGSSIEVQDSISPWKRVLNTTTGTPDLSGSGPCDISLCRINPAFRLAGPSLWVVVSSAPELPGVGRAH